MSSTDNSSLVQQPESRRLEFKEKFPQGNQIAKTAIAFANGAGGKIILGVCNNPQKIIGISDSDVFQLEERITSHIYSECSPVIAFECYIQSIKGKNLLVVEIFPGSNKPYFLTKEGKATGAYIRIGSSTRKASPAMLDELERQSRRISFDTLPAYDVRLEENDFLSFKIDYLKATNRAPVKEFRRKLGLTCTEAGRTYHVNAAVLLSDSPELKRLFPYAKIECARFKGTDMSTFIDQATISGPIHCSVEPCIAFIKKNIALGSRIGEVYRQDSWEYPLSAIREAIINAIIHRDYSITGSDIKVAIFDDMLEITSPGPLPDTLSPEELGSGRSEIRNRTLAPIFKDLKLIEGWGTGIKKMRTSLDDYPQIDLVLNELGYAFQVQFKKKPIKKKTGVKSGTDQAPTKHRPSTDQAPIKHRTSTGQVPDKSNLLDFCRQPRSIKELLAFMQLKHRRTFVVNYLRPLMNEGLIAMTIPDKPTDEKQKYLITSKGQAKINKPK